MKPLFVTAVLAVYLALTGGSVVRAGLRNSIKNLANGATASPHAPVPVTELATPLSCAVDAECGASEFCNDVRGICAPCRKRRKRCARDAMCCGGNHCINGVCQAVEADSSPGAGTADAAQQGARTSAAAVSVTRGQNVTQGPPPPKKSTVSTKVQQVLKGGEGETCLRSSDCSDGLCCARHFWSRICKPVLTEGQVCTRHRRKGTHGLEIFQRCDCAQGLVCRVQRERAGGAESQTQPQPLPQPLPQPQQQSNGGNNRATRNLHTCQPR